MAAIPKEKIFQSVGNLPMETGNYLGIQYVPPGAVISGRETNASRNMVLIRPASIVNRQVIEEVLSAEITNGGISDIYALPSLPLDLQQIHEYVDSQDRILRFVKPRIIEQIQALPDHAINFYWLYGNRVIYGPTDEKNSLVIIRDQRGRNEFKPLCRDTKS